MICPECKTTKLITLETREYSDGSVFRRRGCKACGHRIRTLETITDDISRPYRTRKLTAKRRPGPPKGRPQPNVNRAFGENNAQSVLTARDVQRLRLMASKGVLQKEIAKQFGISTGTVSRIVLRKLWAHVN